MNPMFPTILLPLDGSPLAERALPYAEGLACAAGAQLLLVRAVVVHPVRGPQADAQLAAAVREAGRARGRPPLAWHRGRDRRPPGPVRRRRGRRRSLSAAGRAHRPHHARADRAGPLGVRQRRRGHPDPRARPGAPAPLLAPWPPRRATG